MAEYASPVLRAPSPASSVGTGYGPDQTVFSDTEDQLSHAAFERKWMDRLGLNTPGQQEIEASVDPLLCVPQTAAEERILHERVLMSLRSIVQQLEENEMFEQTLLRGSQAALEQLPVSDNIDTLMGSMMSPTIPRNGVANDTNVTNGPWNSRYHYANDTKGGIADATQESAATAKRTPSKVKGKGKNTSQKD